jgi:hypothetical protein
MPTVFAPALWYFQEYDQEGMRDEANQDTSPPPASPCMWFSPSLGVFGF